MKYTKTKLDNGGFRVAWFIPIEMVMSGAMLGLSLKFGVGWALFIVGIPSFVLLRHIAKLQNKFTKPYAEVEYKRIQAEIEKIGALAYIEAHPFDVTHQYWYEEQVMNEVFHALNPVNKLKILSISKPKLEAKHPSKPQKIPNNLKAYQIA